MNELRGIERQLDDLLCQPYPAYVVCCFMLFLFFPVFAMGGIDLSLSRSTCLPGDLVELRAQSSFEELTHFELQFPKLDAVHVVTHQRQPLRYEQGLYRQQDVWLFQPVQPGEIRFEGLKALLQQGPAESEWVFADLPRLTVSAYPKSDDVTAAEPLPVAGIEKMTSGNAAVWLIVVAFGLGLIGFLSFRSKKVPVRDLPESGVGLNALLIELEAGRLPIGLCEAVLVDKTLQFSEPLRAELERVVYGKATDAETLRVMLREEVLS